MDSFRVAPPGLCLLVMLDVRVDRLLDCKTFPFECDWEGWRGRGGRRCVALGCDMLRLIKRVSRGLNEPTKAIFDIRSNCLSGGLLYTEIHFFVSSRQ